MHKYTENLIFANFIYNKSLTISKLQKGGFLDKMAIERGTPQGCIGTEQTEEYTDYKSVIG
jgi:hypothetical protein